MRKIFLIIILSVFGLTANAQKIDYGNNHTFKLGEYVFKAETYADNIKAGFYILRLDDWDEAKNLGEFLVNNKEKIEKKYDVVFDEIDYGHSEQRHAYVVFFNLYERLSYIKVKQDKREAERRKTEEKKSRMNSLKNVLAP